MDAETLYQLPPEEFIAARDRSAKSLKGQGDAAGAKAIAGLRKPSVSAWLVNRLAAEQGDLLDSLLALGPALAKAQASGRAEDLRALGAQRRQLVEAVTDTAASAAGRPVTAAVREEVAGTLEAALADPASAEAVRSRRLIRPLSYAGFGAVDLAGAVAAHAGQQTRSHPGGKTPTPDRRQAAAPEAKPLEAERLEAKPLEAERLEVERLEAVRAAEVAAHRTAGGLDDAVRASQTRTRRLAAASSALRAAETAAGRARTVLDAAEQERTAARAALERAQEEHDEALQAVQRAQDEAEAARSTLDRLRRG